MVACRLCLLQHRRQDGADHPGGPVRIVLRCPQNDDAVVASFVVAKEFTSIAAWLGADERYDAIGDRFGCGARSVPQIELDQS